MIDLVVEEQLDELDPLRHLRDDPDLDADRAGIVPAQPPSILGQTIGLVFAGPSAGEVDGGDVAITLLVDASPGCGGIAWPAGEVLSRYIARRGSLEGRTVLELGSGTGLVGLVAGKMGAEVWITDQAPLLPIMQRNVTTNDLSSRVHVAELDWSGRGSPLPQDIPRPSLILAADCVYFEPAFPLLVQTLAELVPRGCYADYGDNVEVLFCYKKRRKADKRFFTLLKREFTWAEVTDDPDREVYAREAISLLRLTRKC
ncbi:putative methyltransferase-domain-containing protein [Fomitopsis serialis]|uniref:putative methyltransferase-domain-containing protein n=1 Tax=Fomitopsis serialis TaxID=139415 RepID=UPI0020078D08|nr:putative methyltransferase-domain-containing protein [Neoantrodia serialis]KAH9912709.1 putative methyltransferase-domain-containing protein [Neoantrodia serialis]